MFKTCWECKHLVRISGGIYICLLSSDKERGMCERHPLEKACERFEERLEKRVKRGRLEGVRCRL